MAETGASMAPKGPGALDPGAGRPDPPIYALDRSTITEPHRSVIKAITLTQPWASLVALGAKRIETRSWRTPYRGWLAIHAAKALPKSFHGLDEHFATVGCQRGPSGFYHGLELPRGAVVAIARLVNCVSTDSAAIGQIIGQMGGGREAEWGDYSPGRWAWLLADTVQLEEPVPAKGALGLWDWTPRGLAVGESAWVGSAWVDRLHIPPSVAKAEG